jgi:hypothetical protein
MMSEAVMQPTYDERRSLSTAPTNSVVAAYYDSSNFPLVLDTEELLARLEARGVRNVEIARALDLPDSRVPEIRSRRRRLTLDEAAALDRAFELKLGPPPLPIPVLRLVVRHVGRALGVSQERVHAQLEDLAEDLRAFSEFVSDPKVRRSIEMAEGYFEALIRRPPKARSEARPENDLAN